MQYTANNNNKQIKKYKGLKDVVNMGFSCGLLTEKAVKYTYAEKIMKDYLRIIFNKHTLYKLNIDQKKIWECTDSDSTLMQT